MEADLWVKCVLIVVDHGELLRAMGQTKLKVSLFLVRITAIEFKTKLGCRHTVFTTF